MDVMMTPVLHEVFRTEQTLREACTRRAAALGHRTRHPRAGSRVRQPGWLAARLAGITTLF
jgi:hypothetical protein